MKRSPFISITLAALTLGNAPLLALAEDAAKPAGIEKAADPSKGPPSAESPAPAPAEAPASQSELLLFLKPADAPALPAGAPAEATSETPALAPAPADGRERYEIDPVHSSVQFKVKHLFSYVTGKFSDVSGAVLVDPKDPANSAVNVTIKTASIGTNEAKRDAHLRSEEFFNVEKFPEIKFESQRINVTGEDTAFIIGTLSMHGVDREVILETKFLGKGKGMEGRQHTGWEAKTAVKRSDFGLSWSKAIEGTALVGDDIAITMEIDAVEPKPAGVEVTAADPAAPEPVAEKTEVGSLPTPQPAAPGTPEAPAAAVPAAPVSPVEPAAPAAPVAPEPAPEAGKPIQPEPAGVPAPAKEEQGVKPL